MPFQRFRELLRIFNALYGSYKGRFAVLTILGFFDGLLGALSIGVLVPLFSTIIRGSQSDADFISRFVVQVFAWLGLEPSVATFLAFIGGLFVLKAGVLWLFGYVRMVITNDYVFQTRRTLYERTLGASWPFLSRERLGYLENILMYDVEIATGMLKGLSTMVLDFANFAVYLAVALKFSLFVTLVSAALGIVGFAIAAPFIRKGKRYARKGEALKKRIAHEVNEMLLGFKTIKALGAETVIGGRVIGLFQTVQNIVRQSFFANSFTSDPLQLIGALAIVAIFAISYYGDHNFELTSFLVTMYLLQRLFGYIERAPAAVNAIYRALPHVRRIMDFAAEARTHQEEETGTQAFHFRSTLEFRNVYFSYEGGVPTVSNASFAVRKGEVLGIIGPSGAGKTTIVDLLLRLFTPSAGQIVIDGEEVNAIRLNEWRRQVGYVAQDLFLKNDTIANNIRFYDPTISEAAMAAAARMANIEHVIAAMPHGFETIVGERGVRLSGGERQRIVLARVLARSPQLLILDEATSALDRESEILIKEALGAVRGKITVVIIAHRLSTIMDADCLLVVDRGRIVEQGSARMLLDNKDSYFHRVHTLA
ncbi:MAG: ABC transporter ATP-binding protein [Patescibacteria group bacterium]|nr:ABC transporter ATP-binding protein [Patescibacteria group bacterium]